MRSKLNAPLFIALFGLISIATACGDDGNGTPSNNDAGKGGAGGSAAGGSHSGGSGGSSAGKAGSASGTGGGSSGNAGSMSTNGGEPSSGGESSTNGGEPSTNGGEPSTNGGEPSVNGGQPSGSAGEPATNGGEPSAAGAGGGGAVGCTEITPGDFESSVASAYAIYRTTLTPNLGDVEEDGFSLSIQGPPDYDGGQTGTFDLTQNGDENYKTCTRCFLAIVDPNGEGRKVFYPSEGTLVIDAGSKQLAGNISASVTNLKLVEVTIANDYTSTPVVDGACLTIASANIEVDAPECEGGFLCANGYCLPNPTWQCDGSSDCSDDSDEAPLNPLCEVPEGWTCDEDFVGDGECDCGCGAKDTDCSSTTNEGECDYCLDCGDIGSCSPGYVDPADTTACLP